MATYNLSGININNIAKMKTAIANFKKTLTYATKMWKHKLECYLTILMQK